jgi:hypothetical protein
MKHAAIFLCVVALLAASPLAAQVSDETILTYDVVKNERKDLVMEALDITAEQMKAVSPIYDDYLAELEVLAGKRVDLIKRFLSSYKALEDSAAEQMIDQQMDHDQARLDLRRYYTRRFLEVLPARTVVRLWQIENKLDTVVNAQLVKDVPLAK